MKTNTAVQPQYRYCRKKQCYCTNANRHGECSITACNKTRSIRRIYGNTLKQVIIDERDRGMTSWQGATLESIANELKNIREILEKQSTTEKSSMVGKWIADRYCSECEWDKKDADYTSGWKENYCPN